MTEQDKQRLLKDVDDAVMRWANALHETPTALEWEVTRMWRARRPKEPESACIRMPWEES